MAFAMALFIRLRQNTLQLVAGSLIPLLRKPRACPWMNARKFNATARCHPQIEADNRVIAEG